MEDEENKKLKQKGEKTDGHHVEFRKSRKKGKNVFLRVNQNN